MSEPIWVFLHGWGSDKQLWEPLQARLGGQAVLLELPGFGERSHDQVSHWGAYVDEIAALLPTHCNLVGWSLGGMLAVQLASRAPAKVERVITLAANARFVANAEWPQALAVATFEQFCQDFAEAPARTISRFNALQSQGDVRAKAVLQVLKQQPPVNSQQVEAWQHSLLWLAQMDNRQALASLACPQLHLFGAGDSLVPAAAAEQIAALGATTEVLPGLGHALHVSDPGTVARTILAWASNHPPSHRQVINKRAIARSFALAAATYDSAAHVQRWVAEQLVEEAGHFDRADQVLDLGCGTGFVGQALAILAQAPCIYLTDLAATMVGHAQQKLPCCPGVAGDAEALPFAAASFDVVVSSLALQWCDNLTQVGLEVVRCLKQDGRFVFSTLGPQTLHELRQAWSKLDGYVHVNAFKTADQVRAQLQQAGLQVRSIRSVPRVLYYTELMPMLRELKAIGAHNMNPGRNRGLTRPQQFVDLQHAYRTMAGKDGLLPVTYDVLLVEATKQTFAGAKHYE